ncbi:hypothetical protein FAI41_08405 [Acetobacteraceae bacterium]|nr:hypothetical protein FAI41_08405 [Acetobacteraceae bacterium]
MIFEEKKDLEFRAWFKAFLRFMLPALGLGVLALFFSVPFRIPGRPELQVAILLEAVWFYTMYAPQMMWAGNIFVGGLLCEIFVPTPPGFLVFWMIMEAELVRVVRMRLCEGGFLFSWFLFSFVSCGASLSLWGLFALRDFLFLSPHPAMFFCLLSIGIYPLFYLLWNSVLYFFLRTKR